MKDKTKELREEFAQRRRMEETLRESEAFQSGLLANSPTPIDVINPDGSMRYINPALEKLTGFSADELIGQKPPYPYWPKERRQEIMKEFKKAIRQRGERVPELYQKKNGDSFWVEITSTPVRKDGKFQYLLSSWVDITESKKAEEKLRESEARYRAVIEGAHDMIQSIAHDGSIIFVNKSWRDTLGYTEAELSGLNLFNIIHPDSMAHCQELFKQVMSGKPVHGIEAAFLTKDGRKILVEGNAAPRYIGDRVVATQGIFRDVTETKLKEKDYQNIIHTTTDGFWIIDKGGRFLDVNNAYCALIGYSREELLNMNIRDIEAAEKPEETARHMRRIIKAGHDRFETRHRCKDGRIVDIEVSTTYAGADDGRLFTFLRDITARKQAEDALRDEATRRHILIDQSSDGIAILDEEGKIYEANQRFAEMLGYTPEEVIKLRVWDFEAQLNREQILEMIRTMDESGDHFETKHRRKDGTVFDVEISSNGAVYAGQKLIFSVCRDITARKQAEEKISHLSSFPEMAPIPELELDQDGNILYLNPVAKSRFPDIAILGRSHPFLVNWSQVIKEFQDNDWTKTIVREVEANSSFYEQIISPVDKNQIRIYSRDITERKQAEDKLRDEETRRRILVDQSRDGIVILDEKGKVYEANLKFAEMLRCTPEEVRELHVWDWEFQYPPEQVAEMIRTVDETGDHFETKHRRKDGTIYDVEISTNGAIIAGQKLIFCVCRDITARKQAEAALKESEEKHKNLVEATSDIIWEADAEGRFTFISPRVKDVLGYEVDEVVGKKRTLDLLPKGEARRWLKRFKELSAKKAPFFGFEIPHIHKDGRQFIFETSGIPLFDGAGNLKGYVGIDKDVTERRQMQEQLIITDRLASVGELAAGIAHELNNPLTGVVGFSQLLMEKEMPEDIRQDVQVVYQEAQRTSQVVKNLLTFARKHAAVKEKVNINEVINKVLELRAYEQNLENIKVKAHYDSALPEVMADYFQLQQVFLNIVINAEYFMKEAHNEGTLTITTEKVGNKIRASFADDGPGIAQENLGHIFDPFFTTKEVGRGTGLGLSICHGVIAEHGGRIYVESELGKGATFIVELPIAAVERRKGGAL
jgi:PAS domain S-box-containing protein